MSEDKETAAAPDPWQVITDVMSELLRGGQTADIRCRAALGVLERNGISFGKPLHAAQDARPAPAIVIDIAPPPGVTVNGIPLENL